MNIELSHDNEKLVREYMAMLDGDVTMMNVVEFNTLQAAIATMMATKLSGEDMFQRMCKG